MSTFSGPTVVPWRNPEQFLKVYKCLYSKSINDKRWAVDQISVWETRCYPVLPNAVEATVTIVRAVIQDLLSEVNKSFCQPNDVQLMYSMAVVRFVNLMVEDQQEEKLTVNDMAAMKNVPPWIIGLRNEVAHALCPSLPVLRMASETALEYLEMNFWKIEADSIWPVVKNHAKAKQKIKNLLVQYKNIQFQRLEKKVSAKELKADLTSVLRALRDYLVTQKQLVLDCLVQHGMFVSPDDLAKILSHSAQLYLEFDTDIPERLEKFWLPLIRILHSCNLVPHFLEKLILSMEHCGVDISQKVVAAWSMRFLMVNSTYKTTSALDSCFVDKGILFDFYRLLHACMRGSNEFMVPVFELIVSRLGAGERFHQMYCIFALNQGWLVESTPAEPRRVGPKPASKRAKDEIMQEIVFSLEDIEEDLNELHTRRKRLRKDNSWSLAPVVIDWSEIPLGAVLHPANESEEKNGSPKSEQKQDVFDEEPTRFILINENDNEEITAEETVTPEICRETYMVEMVYRRRQKN